MADDDFLIENKRNIDKLATKKSGINYDPSVQLSFEEIEQLDKKYILNTYNRMPVAFQYGSGEFLYDTEGKEYIDFLSGIAVTGAGHAHADLVERLNSQADMLWHTSNLFYNQQQAMLARAIVEITFPGKVFFCNSGTEANEGALKAVRAHGQSISKSKTKVVTLNNSFHGRTYGSMSLTAQEKIHSGYGPILTDMQYVEPNDIDELTAVFDENVAGIFIEPIQGEGGVLPINIEFIEIARRLCDDYDALLVFDEIQSGMGRTGKYFAYQHYEVDPDILTMAKGLGGGFPIGAILFSEKNTELLKPGMHGSTFGGNHLACAVAYDVIRLFEANDVLDNVAKVGDYLYTGLEAIATKHPDKIDGVRGVGLLLGLVLNKNIEARRLVKKALEYYLVIGRAGENILRFAPPLVLRKTTVDRALERIEKLIDEI